MENLLAHEPIIVNENMGVIDGQHRLMAAKNLSEYIYYTIAPGMGLKHVQLLNGNVKAWSLNDFLLSYIDQGNEDYIAVKDFSNKHNMSLSNSIAMLSISEDSKYLHAPYREFKRGHFKIKNQELADDFVEFYKKVSEYTHENTSKDRDFLRALFHLYRGDEVDIEKFLSKLVFHEHPLYRRANVVDYLRQFEDVYNKYSKTDSARLY
jgi:hypothetical protein